MQKSLVIENNPYLRKMYAINLITYVGSEVLLASNAAEAQNVLDADPEISLVICRSKCKKEASADIISKELAEKRPQGFLIVIGDDEKVSFPETVYLHSGLDIKDLIKNSARCLGVTAKDMAQLAVPDYFPVPTSYAMDIKRSACDVFVKRENDYQKLIEANEDFPENLIAGAEQSGDKLIYVNKMERLNFCNNVTQELVGQVAAGELNADEQITASDMGQQLVGHKLKTIGVTKETVEFANQTMKQISSNAKKSPKLGRLLKRMLKNKNSYQFKQTQILTYLGLHILKHIDWGNNEEQFEKFSFIAFFHNISLANDEECMIRTNEQLKQLDLDPDIQKRVEQHAMKSAEMIHNYPGAPMAVDQIIKQHHGVLNGVGFSDTFGANLSPITIVFVLAEDFADYIIRSGNEINVAQKIGQMRGRYSTQRFQKIIDLLEEVIL
jgi:hypothetical protein